ncbi:hypothetical protein HMPREF1084_02992 [Clostridium butyricum 60E.3]|uniref:YjfB family protein n=1 Tax=Clostridium butyricum TaxID=1492 RepID=UPI0002D1620B|nr:YjfB family protein [Clostridium butyricum]ENZ31473.1 hypothetical protein HMPREF1084_02992 [Clostridium butyricum 60E.3]MDU5720684.1 YjfB family protein [Clostridium butyricum]MDU5818488.1 YjfB family protein [Clostridium butyricum]
MDLVSLAMNLSQASLATKVATSVTKMAMDDGVQAATQMTEMIGNAIDPNLGNKIDVRA